MIHNLKKLPLVFISVLFFIACRNSNPHYVAERNIEALNREAFDCRYKNIDSSRIKALNVVESLDSAQKEGTIDVVDFYNSQKARAWNTIAYSYFLASNYDSAMVYINRIRNIKEDYRNKEIEEAISSIVEAKFFKRKCQCKEVYSMLTSSVSIFDFRCDLLINLPREIVNALKYKFYLKKFDRERYNWAKSEYLFGLAALNKYYMGSDFSKVVSILDKIKNNQDLQPDNTQKIILYYIYAKDYFSALDSKNPQYLDSAYVYLKKGLDMLEKPEDRIDYFLAMNCRLIAQMLVDSTAGRMIGKDPIDIYRIKQKYIDPECHSEEIGIDSPRLPLLLFEKANAIFENGADRYQTMVSRIFTGDYYLLQGDSARAETLYNESLKYCEDIKRTGGGALKWRNKIYLRLINSATEKTPITQIKQWNGLLYTTTQTIADNAKKDRLFKKQAEIEQSNFKVLFLIVFIITVLIGLISALNIRKTNKNKNALNEANETGFKIMSSMNEIETVIPEVGIQKLKEIINKEFHFFFNMHIPCICLFDNEKNVLKFACGKDVSYSEPVADDKTCNIKHLSIVCFKKKKEIYTMYHKNDTGFFKMSHLDVEMLPPPSAFCFMPLKSGKQDKLIGVITIQSKNKFNSFHRLLLRTVSSYIAVALDTLQRNGSMIEDWAITDTYNSIIRHEIRPKIQIEIPDYLAELKNAINKNNQTGIQKELERLFGVSDSLLQIFNTLSTTPLLTVRKLPLKFSSFDIREIFTFLKVMKRNTNPNVELIFDMEKPHWVIADRVLIELLLRALIQNAINYTREGSITVSAAEYELDNEFIQVFVKDTGEGISEEVKKSIFSICDEAKSDNGHGFGLILCQHIIKLHTNSKIGVESKINEGSAFYFTLKKADINNE